jgi:hypothetical protein
MSVRVRLSSNPYDCFVEVDGQRLKSVAGVVVNYDVQRSTPIVCINLVDDIEIEAEDAIVKERGNA